MCDNTGDMARNFFQAISKGELPKSLITDDFCAWVMRSGEIGKDRFAMGAQLLATIFDGSLVYSIESLTTEDDRVVAEVKSNGTLINGKKFENVNVFIFRVRDGKFSSVKEYMDPIVVNEELAPLIEGVIKNMGNQH